MKSNALFFSRDDRQESNKKATGKQQEKNRALAGPVVVLADRSQQSPSRGEQLAAPRPTPGRNVDRLPTAQSDYGLRRPCEQRRIPYGSHAVTSRRPDLRTLIHSRQ